MILVATSNKTNKVTILHTSLKKIQIKNPLKFRIKITNNMILVVTRKKLIKSRYYTPQAIKPKLKII